VLLSLSFPISLVSNLFITFYWHEKIQSTKTVVLKHLEKARYPFGVIAGIMFALEILSSTLRSYWVYSNALQTLNGVLYILITFGIALFFEIVGARILIRLRRAQQGQKGSQRKSLILNRVSLFLLCLRICRSPS
jgi:uncharacterized protein (DUF486 family)